MLVKDLFEAPGGRGKIKIPPLPSFPREVYREIKASSIDQINFNALGPFWTEEVGFADSYNYDLVAHNDDSRPNRYLLSTKVTEKMVDLKKTKQARKDVVYGEEMEVHLKRGTPVTVKVEGIIDGSYKTVTRKGKI